MIKKITLVSIVFMLFIASLPAQNVQLHYDTRHTTRANSAADRASKNYLFTTVEAFKPDKWGTTFFFIDMVYSGSKGNMTSAYWEIARDIKMWDFPLAAHLEYNGGVSAFGTIPGAYLIGPSYSFAMGDVHLGSYLVYKYNAFMSSSHDAQLTGIWNWTSTNKKITLSGFADLWSENKDRIGTSGSKKLIFVAQPQVWFNVTQHFSLGSEVEISKNFYSCEINVLPTLAAKWIF
ncbi:DUF5020 domain-containing protein [Bacteroidales bacterium]|nr:DUF5020 domain-containing protein [Bacteroidales bacterium]